jgi:hypothetical protein
VKRVNPNLYFPNGYSFTEADGTLIKAGSWRSLYDKVRTHRKINGKPPGDPENEVQQAACDRSPQLCHEDSPSVPKPRTEKQRNESLKSAVLRNMSELARRVDKKEANFVSDALAAARADVCRRCPLQVEVGGGCGSCKAAIRGLAKQIRGKHPELPGVACSIFQSHTPSQAYFDDPAVRNDSLPPDCWRRAE